MDCREAQELISALHDGEDVGQARVDLEAHLAGCAECAAFSRGMSALDAVSHPRAPEGLAERISAVVSDLPSPIEAAFTMGLPSLEPETAAASGGWHAAVAGAEWLTRGRLWAATATLAVCASIVAVGIVVTQQNVGQVAVEQAARDAVSRSLGGPPAVPNAGYSGAAPSAPAQKEAVATPPQYVSYNAGVYRATDSQNVTSSDLTTIGVVTTALDSQEPPATLTAFRWTLDPRAIVLRRGDGSYATFAAVVRSVDGKNFQLQTGRPIARYGEWPTLPAGMTEPTLPDGSPVFKEAGVDSVGVKVYKRIGQSVDEGCAVAPGTESSDAAAGNPGWTWWSPVQ